MFDYLIIGSGIGASGFISKLEKTDVKVGIVSLNKDKQVNFHSSGFKYEYLIRKDLGNVYDWGGVLTLSNYVLNNYPDNFYDQAISNYFKYSKYQELNNKFSGNFIKNELTPRKITENIHFRKLFISDKKTLYKSFYKKVETHNITKILSEVERFYKEDGHYIVLTKDNVKLKTRKIVLCSGSIGTRLLLENSGYISQSHKLKATDSKFGRIGRIRFDKKLPFGFFHHHLISKKIRFKTGYEVNRSNATSMFFLQPAIENVPSSDIHLLKQFLTLKTDFTLKNLIKFMANPKAILQILLMEFSIFDTTKEFDVYCISDFGMREYTYNKIDKSYDVELEGYDSNLIDNYKCFIEYLKSHSDVRLVDHQVEMPLLANLESALHMCGSVGYELDISFNRKSRLFHLKSDSNIIINDNSVIINKGIANPSIQLF